MSSNIEKFRERLRLTQQTQQKKADISKSSKKEEEEQTKYKTEKAAKLGTKPGKTHTNVHDAQKGLTQFLKDTNKINTTQAKNYTKIQANNNTQLATIINTVEGNTYKAGSGQSYYSLKDGTPITSGMVDQWKNDLADGKTNLVLLKAAVKQGEANKPIYNKIIKQLEEESIKPHPEKAYTYKSQAQKYIKEHTTTKTPEPKSTLQRRSDAQKSFISTLIKADIKDPKKAEKLIKEISPIYAQTVDVNPGAGDKFVKELDLKIRNYEKIADYQTPLGWDELTGSNKKQNINKLKARLAHATLATDKYLIAEAPVMALGAAGGPATVGFIAAAGIATMLNPANRKLLDEYVKAHPQEFMFAIGGSILAGLSVSAAKGIYKQYRVDMSLAQQTKYDKMINDYAYLEQNKGAEFPSRALEVPERYGNQIIVSNPVDAEAQIFERFLRGVQTGNEGEAIQAFFKSMKDADLSMYLDAGGGKLDTVTVPDLLNKYPGLRDPYFNPAFNDPNILGKSDLVARSNNPSVNFMPLLAAALLQVSKQGYITETQIKELIKTNQLNITTLRDKGIEIPTDFTESSLVELSLPELAELAKTKQEQIQELTPLQIQALIVDVVPLPLPDIPETPEPLKPTLPLGLSKNDMSKRRDMDRKFYTGPKSIYRVTYIYSKTSKQTLPPIEARSIPEAMQKAQRAKEPNRKPWIMIDIEKVKG